jgi:hypothetical protein
MGKTRPAAVPRPPSAAVREEWLRRTEAEYRSAAVSAHLAHWLVQVGASPDLVRAALRIAREELSHATMSHRVHRAAGGARTPSRPAIDRASLELSRHPGEPLENDIARVAVEVYCLGETVAVRLFQALRAACEVPAARRVLDRILRDEVGHRDFGWALLGWLLALPGQGDGLRALVEAELPAAFARLRATYAPGGPSGRGGGHTDGEGHGDGEGDGGTGALARVDAAWGLMRPARYGEILRQAVRKDYVPRFQRAGLGDESLRRAFGGV